jgi:hypothetical protein
MDTHRLYKKQKLYIQNDLLYNYIAKLLSTAGTDFYETKDNTLHLLIIIIFIHNYIKNILI